MRDVEKKYFSDQQTSGLNSDDADFSIGLNQVINSENVIWGSTDIGVVNTVESIGGTEIISEAQPSVTFISIGSAVDTVRNRFFYFLYNIYTPDHKIMAYDKDSGSVYTVLLSSQITGGLNFNKDFPIHSAKVVGDLLYWTDNHTDPKRINVEAAIKLNNPGYQTEVTAYTVPLNQSVITVIRRPPGRVLSLAFSTIPLRENFLLDFSGQFSYRYVYRDGEVSAFAPPTEFVNYRYKYGTNLSTENAVTASLNLPAANGEFIEQDVQIIEMAVRYNNDPNYFIIKRYDKRNATDAASISVYNSGAGSLSVTFLNEKKGDPVDNASSVKPFDSVPFRSETIETGLRRLFMANNTNGIDTPLVTSLNAAEIATPAAVTGVAKKIFKSYSSYQIGLRFRDNYKRSTGVVTNSNLVVEIPDRGDRNDNSFVENIPFTLSNTNAINEIPEEAYYYDVLISKNNRVLQFVQWLPNVLKYAIKNTDGTYTYQNTYSGNVMGLAFGTSSLNLQGGMGISFTQGDFVRVYLDGLSVPPFSAQALDQASDYIIVAPRDLGSLNLLSFVLIEYYTPSAGLNEGEFYTTGLSYRVSAPGTDGRQYSVLNGNIPGDVYFTERAVLISGAYYTESMSPNDDHWQDWFGLFGEKNRVDLIGRRTNVNSIQWSNVYLEGTGVNGLSTFDALDEKPLPLDMGSIQKLQQTSKVEEQGNIMLAIGENETASIYLGETQIVGADSNAFLASSPGVVGTINVLRGNFGTINPESVTEYRGNVFWYDAKNGRIIQYSTNGLYPISNYKMTRFWSLFSKQYMNMTNTQIEALGNRPFVYMTVDPHHDLLLVSIPKLLNTPPKGYLPDYPSTIYPFDIWDGQGKTIVYDLKPEPNRWLGAFQFVAENFITLNDELYSIKNGQLYIHNQPNYNQIYGAVLKSRLMCVSNKDTSAIKVYDNIAVEANMKPTLVYVYNDYPYPQASDLVDYDPNWMELEGVFNAALRRNKLKPNASGYSTDGLMTGEKMRGAAMKIMLEFTVSNMPLEFKFLNIGYTISKGNKNI